MAAYYLFESAFPHRRIDPDTAFTELVKLVVPVGTGAVGLIAAGLLAAILSTIDSLLNSSATIVAVDLYKPYVRPHASDRELILIGRLATLGFVLLAVWIAINAIDPNSEANFFLQIAHYQNHLTPGILVAFLMGMFWRRGTAGAAFVTILSSVFASWLLEWTYNEHLGRLPGVSAWLGERLNFFHRVIAVMIFAMTMFTVVSLFGTADAQKGRLVWTDLGGHSSRALQSLGINVLLAASVFAILGWGMHARWVEWLTPAVAGLLAAAWTLLLFARPIADSLNAKLSAEGSARRHWSRTLVGEDRLWAAVLCALVFATRALSK